MQFQGRLMIQTRQNGKKPHFGPDLGTRSFPKFGPKSFFRDFS